ncbi:MAG: AraC family transcriptional regulator [Candidatus Aminicenantes bacterium]|nr:AraC family transcriptional regulator [Candidatus Aminicenantes bacterium]
MINIAIFSVEGRLYELIRIIFKKADYVKIRKIDKGINEVEQPVLILTSCNYQCDLSFCSKKFYFLSQNKAIPFFVLRPIWVKQVIGVPFGFFLCPYLEYRLSKVQKRILDLIKEAKFCASSAKYLPLFHPMSKIIMAQRRIVEDPKRISYLADVCEQLKVSTSWLSKKFKDISGISFSDFLAKVKCCQALWELISSDKLIKEIALDLGYMPLYFSQLFRSQFGVSPSFIRKQLIPEIALMNTF